MITTKFVIGFHGCDAGLARAVINGEADLQAVPKLHPWLGDGVYFWEESPARAWQWAEHGVKTGDIKQPAVVGAIIELHNCLNLIDPNSFSIVQDAHAHYVGAERARGKVPKKNSGKGTGARYLDCAVLNTVHLMRERDDRHPPAFDTVRAFFTEGDEPIYEGAQLRKHDHVQVCVRTTKCILGYFLPRG